MATRLGGGSLAAPRTRRASILVLLQARRPSAILRRVRAVVVDAINGQIGGWARPHVAIERLEAGGPRVADRYTSPAVALEVLALRVKATVLNASPNPVFRGVAHAVLAMVNASAFSRHLYAQAAATLRVSCSQCAQLYGDFLAAVAATTPPRRAWLVRTRDALTRNEATESLTAQIKPLHIGILA